MGLAHLMSQQQFSDLVSDKENALEGKRGNQTDTDRGTTVPCDHHVDCPLGPSI